MHIISGFIVAMVAGRLKKDKGLSGLPHLKTGPVRVGHALPGRIRVMVPDLKGAGPGEVTRLEKLGSLPGVTSAQANPVSGSVVIRYDHKSVTPSLILMALSRILGKEEEVINAATPKLMAGLRQFGTGLNRAVYEEAHGLVDLNTLLALALLAAGGAKLWQERTSGMPPGAVLLWWGLSIINRRNKGGN
ncbi:MAG: hypothetical protein MI863_12885 [Desulfobacterales bacterium]|nr:hypothetical protein [Desulfobacterales bacterium]